VSASTATYDLSTLSLHDALPICCLIRSCGWGQVEPLEVGCPGPVQGLAGVPGVEADAVDGGGSGEVLQAGFVQAGVAGAADAGEDRKSTRLNSSHVSISYAVFCL